MQAFSTPNNTLSQKGKMVTNGSAKQCVKIYYKMVCKVKVQNWNVENLPEDVKKLKT